MVRQFLVRKQAVLSHWILKPRCVNLSFSPIISAIMGTTGKQSKLFRIDKSIIMFSTALKLLISKLVKTFNSLLGRFSNFLLRLM